MLNLLEHWPCDRCLKVETEVISQSEVISLSSAFPVLGEGNSQHCLLCFGSDCQGTQENHSELGNLEEWGLSSA